MTNIVILDRDGVINVDSREYIKTPDEWVPIPGSLEAIALLHRHNYQVFIATNQAGVGRGILNETSLSKIHDKMTQMVQDAGGKLSGIFYCPHHPNDQCHCRKPKPGMLFQIEKVANVPVKNQPFVGDSLKDIQAAEAAGCEPILVLTGSGRDTQRQVPETIKCFADLQAFARARVAPAVRQGT